MRLFKCADCDKSASPDWSVFLDAGTVLPFCSDCRVAYDKASRAVQYTINVDKVAQSITRFSVEGRGNSE